VTVITTKKDPEAFTAGVLWNAIWRGRWLVVGCTILFTALGMTYVLLAKPVYEARVVVLPIDIESSARTSLSRLVVGGLAELGLGSLGGSRSESMGVLQSRQLLEDFIRDENLLPQLYSDKWDTVAKRWRVDQEDAPTLWQAVDYMEESIRRVSEDRRSGRVVLTVEWHDPEVAARWANALVSRANETLRDRTVEAAEKSLKFLEAQLRESSVLEVRQSIYGAIEGQLNTTMLARARPDYALRVIDPATVPDKRDPIRPRRVIIVAASFAFGFCAALGLITAWAILSWARATIRDA
jgi:uncharacterized protein involved in exopolysaccharide biosynthesis